MKGHQFLILVFLSIAAVRAELCPNQLVVEQRPYPPSGCRSFLLCIFGMGQVFECPPGDGYAMIWVRGFCEEGDPVTCEPGPVTTPAPPVRPPPVEGQACEGVNFGLRAHQEYCWKYVWCLFGFGFEYECPETTIFSERTNLCVRGNRNTCTFSLRPTGRQTNQF